MALSDAVIFHLKYENAEVGRILAGLMGALVRDVRTAAPSLLGNCPAFDMIWPLLPVALLTTGCFGPCGCRRLWADGYA